MTQWLYKIVPSRPAMVVDATADEVRIVADHFQYLVELRDRGALIIAGRTQETVGTLGLVIYDAEDETSARDIMNADPAVAAGVFVASLHPYAVAVARDGLED